ncbi:MAG: MotA/TolQ/ExbB proton channel family protein [Oligoflexia bacterium]|nr:MotA/TolQ/ExbB proton channel family protein [Oligoflexia bacterium]
MTLPLALEQITGDLGIELLLVLFMLGCSLFLVAIALERLFLLARVRASITTSRRVVLAARNGKLSDAAKIARSLSGPVAPIFVAGLERAVGRVRGQPVRAMMRECKRVGGAMRSRTWLLATAGALMPFVGLFGTVIGVMSAFQAIGESGQGGFAIVSVGISQALIATAVGIAVALEGVVLFNLLQSIAQRLARDLSMLVDELVELIETEEASRAASSAE